jgi:hypothetical protein
MEVESSAGRNLILHIGTEKTGSTSIQTFLRLNHRRLAANGIGVPVCLGDTLHFKLQLMANDDDVNDDFIRNLGLHRDPRLRKETLLEWRNTFYTDVITSPAHTWIISCETLHSRLIRDTEVERLKEILSPLFRTITVVVYLRDPILMAISRLTEKAKSSCPVLLPEPQSSTKGFDVYDHRKTVLKWQGLYGGGKLKVRLFEQETLVGGDVVLDFMDICQLNPSQYKLVGNQNTSMSAVGLALMEEINRHVPRRWVDGTLIKSRWLLVCHVLQHMRGGAGYRPSIKDVEAYNQHYAESNEWVRLHFFPERRSLFKPNCLTEIAQVETGLDQAEIQRVGRLVANIWLTKVAQIKQLEAQVEFLKARLESLGAEEPVTEHEAPSTDWQKYVER